MGKLMVRKNCTLQIIPTVRYFINVTLAYRLDGSIFQFIFYMPKHCPLNLSDSCKLINKELIPVTYLQLPQSMLGCSYTYSLSIFVFIYISSHDILQRAMYIHETFFKYIHAVNNVAVVLYYLFHIIIIMYDCFVLE